MGHRSRMAVVRDNSEALAELSRITQNPNTKANVITLNYVALMRLKSELGLVVMNKSQVEALKSFDSASMTFTCLLVNNLRQVIALRFKISVCCSVLCSVEAGGYVCCHKECKCRDSLAHLQRACAPDSWYPGMRTRLLVPPNSINMIYGL
jgi:hypothetical protein